MSEWIRASERLPEIKDGYSEDVLFIVIEGWDGEELPEIYTGCRCLNDSGEECWCQNHSTAGGLCELSDIEMVTHWRPLPKPPEIDELLNEYEKQLSLWCDSHPEEC